MKPVLRLPPRNNNSNLLSPSNSRSTLPLLITRTYALPPSVALYTLPSFPLVENRRKISNSQDRRSAMHVRKIWPRLFDRLCGRPLHFIDPTFAEPSPSLLDSWPLCAVKRIASASGAEGYRACRLGCGPETMVDSDVSLRRQRGMLAPLSLLPAEELLRY